MNNVGIGEQRFWLPKKAKTAHKEIRRVYNQLSGFVGRKEKNNKHAFLQLSVAVTFGQLPA